MFQHAIRDLDTFHPPTSCFKQSLARMLTHVQLQALQLLGKVGGRCRKGKEVPSLVHRDNPENGLRFFLSFQPAPPFLLPMDSIVAACSRAFNSRLEGDAQTPFPFPSDLCQEELLAQQ